MNNMHTAEDENDIMLESGDLDIINEQELDMMTISSCGEVEEDYLSELIPDYSSLIFPCPHRTCRIYY